MARTNAVLAVVATAISLVVVVVPAAAAPIPPVPSRSYDLPAGFRPEGIAIGTAPVAYLGSLADGDLYRLDLLSGRGQVFSQGPGTSSVGLKIDRRQRLFVAGGQTGEGRVVDAKTGEPLKTYRLWDQPGAFVNDVVVTDAAVFFTDSFNARLYKIALGPHGRLPDASTTVPLSGDFHNTPGAFNANGIAETPDGKALLVVQSSTGQLHNVDANGVSRVVDLGGERVPGGDGLLLRGRTLYVVRGSANEVVEIRLDRAGTSGKIVKRHANPKFDVPTTVAAFGDTLYLPNARFGTTPTPETTYTVESVHAN
ncbi:hypothetical protein GCM10022243_22110 [Saccharothrix violaceirubra]|uniref:Sugar lactone lactonase YvrE n=1 Tax=Saccharothrix violaceirubra TaxID=413306 RepID=A0A7W7T1J7_9PSEU|nr:superoxide dismutase [Saccharothrix violaceirubra]MBB4964853.1 sugar lactone lactonase YvrE [Saccharothrix violaceirubra]